MLTCSNCGAHKREGACPSCGANWPAVTASTAVVLLGLVLAGCGTSQALYGVVVTDRGGDTSGQDRDGDGFVGEDGGGDDCDDDNEDVNPDAAETPGHGLDSNCDGEDDI